MNFIEVMISRSIFEEDFDDTNRTMVNLNLVRAVQPTENGYAKLWYSRNEAECIIINLKYEELKKILII